MQFLCSIWKILHLTEYFYTGTAHDACNKYQVWFSNLFFPMARKSPPLPLQFAFGWAMSNFGQDTTRDGQELLFCEQNTCNLKDLRAKEDDLKDNRASGVTSIHLPMLSLVANSLIWPNMYNLRKNYFIFGNLTEKIFWRQQKFINWKLLTWAPGDLPGKQMISGLKIIISFSDLLQDIPSQ